MPDIAIPYILEPFVDTKPLDVPAPCGMRIVGIFSCILQVISSAFIILEQYERYTNTCCKILLREYQEKTLYLFSEDSKLVS